MLEKCMVGVIYDKTKNRHGKGENMSFISGYVCGILSMILLFLTLKYVWGIL
jgi:dipeptide/tripeptide permease